MRVNGDQADGLGIGHRPQPLDDAAPWPAAAVPCHGLGEHEFPVLGARQFVPVDDEGIARLASMGSIRGGWPCSRRSTPRTR